MKMVKQSFYFQLLFTIVLWYTVGNMNSYGQDVKERKWFASLDLGAQMSGIKSEDFVSSNYSPVYRLSLGREFSPYFAVQVGYQGRYFRAISDDLKYKYNFYFVEGMVNMTSLLFGKKEGRKYNFWFHAGPGYFYHEIYQRSNIHWNLGGSNLFFLSEKIHVKIDLSAIAGWDIYQGDSDILPNATIGIIYHF